MNSQDRILLVCCANKNKRPRIYEQEQAEVSGEASLHPGIHFQIILPLQPDSYTGHHTLDGFCPVRAPATAYFPPSDLDRDSIAGAATYYTLPRYFNRLPPKYETVTNPVKLAYGRLFHFLTERNMGGVVGDVVVLR